jgi:hypothetical protein
VATIIDPIHSPASASAWLNALGVKRSKATLNKLRCIGGGPRFVKIGRREVGYPESCLATYVDELISAPLASTSEVRRPRSSDRGDRETAPPQHEICPAG